MILGKAFRLFVVDTWKYQNSSELIVTHQNPPTNGGQTKGLQQTQQSRICSSWFLDRSPLLLRVLKIIPALHNIVRHLDTFVVDTWEYQNPSELIVTHKNPPTNGGQTKGLQETRQSTTCSSWFLVRHLDTFIACSGKHQNPSELIVTLKNPPTTVGKPRACTKHNRVELAPLDFWIDRHSYCGY